jgi:hypothetical protein
VIFNHRIERRVKIDPTDKDKFLFKNLVFYFEILHDGKTIDGYFKNRALEFGGRVLNKLVKTVTHLVWSGGTQKTLIKAQELDIKIVSPLWFEKCIQDLELADEASYGPPNLKEL